jgi:hypothetical protein
MQFLAPFSILCSHSLLFSATASYFPRPKQLFTGLLLKASKPCKLSFVFPVSLLLCFLAFPCFLQPAKFAKLGFFPLQLNIRNPFFN